MITTYYHYAIDVYAGFELASRGSDFKGMSLLNACDCRSYKYDCFGGQVGTLIGVDGTSFDAPEQNRNSGEEGSVRLYGGGWRSLTRLVERCVLVELGRESSTPARV